MDITHQSGARETYLSVLSMVLSWGVSYLLDRKYVLVL